MKTNEIVKENNRKLLSKMIPDKSDPILGNSFTNPLDAVFGLPIKNNN